MKIYLKCVLFGKCTSAFYSQYLTHIAMNGKMTSEW